MLMSIKPRVVIVVFIYEVAIEISFYTSFGGHAVTWKSSMIITFIDYIGVFISRHDGRLKK